MNFIFLMSLALCTRENIKENDCTNNILSSNRDNILSSNRDNILSSNRDNILSSETWTKFKIILKILPKCIIPYIIIDLFYSSIMWLADYSISESNTFIRMGFRFTTLILAFLYWSLEFVNPNYEKINRE